MKHTLNELEATDMNKFKFYLNLMSISDRTEQRGTIVLRIENDKNKYTETFHHLIDVPRAIVNVLAQAGYKYEIAPTPLSKNIIVKKDFKRGPSFYQKIKKFLINMNKEN
jgi:hypothetical protein